jgi:hypothetical protein
MSTSAEVHQVAMDAPLKYQIRVQGYLDYRWSAELGNLIIVNEFNRCCRPSTLLLGRLRDQATLLSILNHLYNLGLPLLAVHRLNSTSQKPN